MLINFEGIDGCGKSTQIHLLKQYLEERGRMVQVYREPGGTSIAEEIRSILLDSKNEVSAISELLLFSAARAQLVQEKILPALERGITVILDRFYDSTTAYQGYGRSVLPIDEIILLNKMASMIGTRDHFLFEDISRISPSETKRTRPRQNGNGGQ